MKAKVNVKVKPALKVLELVVATDMHVKLNNDL